MSRCPRCHHQFRTLPDEVGDHPCPKCGLSPWDKILHGTESEDEQDDDKYLDPQNFETFHECSEQRQWELFRNMRAARDAAELERDANGESARHLEPTITHVDRERAMPCADDHVKQLRQNIDELHALQEQERHSRQLERSQYLVRIVQVEAERDDARLCARVLWDWIGSHSKAAQMGAWADRWPWLMESEGGVR